MIRSLKEPRGFDCTRGCDGGASICGITGTSILGGGGGGGGGGLNRDAPGGRICADATSPTISTKVIAQIKIDNSFIESMS